MIIINGKIITCKYCSRDATTVINNKAYCDRCNPIEISNNISLNRDDFKSIVKAVFLIILLVLILIGLWVGVAYGIIKLSMLAGAPLWAAIIIAILLLK